MHGMLRTDRDDRRLRSWTHSTIRVALTHGVMSPLLPKADMCGAKGYVCLVPKADIRPHSINSSARERSEYGTVRPRALAVVRLIIN